MENVDFVKVGVRIRPCLSTDVTVSSSLQVINKCPPIILINDRNLTYSFDHLFLDDASQDNVYKNMVQPLVNQVKAGYNCTVFAYGSTGTGKTYTMGSNPQLYEQENGGFIPRTLEDFFVTPSKNVEVTISISFYEIYNEKVYDLLQNSKKPLLVKGFKIRDLCNERVTNSQQAYKLLLTGGKNRHIAETKQNNQSSRSHAIFTIYCRMRYENTETLAKLNLVDLAGSESVKRTGNFGSKFHEGVNINKGLFNLGRVINGLCSNEYVPYRQSVITSVLQDSLNKNNYVSLVACISPINDDVQETISTLDFAQNVRNIKNEPEINNIISQYKKNNPALFTSAIKIRQTPLKRSELHCQTSFIKKTRPELLSINNTTESPRSLQSLSFSSVSEIQQSASPIIRKCIDAMETTILNKVETIIENNLTCTRKFTVENSSPFVWNKLYDTVRRIVKHELHLNANTINNHYDNVTANKPTTSKNRHDTPAITSIRISKNLFQSPINSTSTPHTSFTEHKSVEEITDEDDGVFKLPRIPARVKPSIKASTSKAPVINEESDEDFKKPLTPTRRKDSSSRNLRRSMRLAERHTSIIGDFFTPMSTPRQKTNTTNSNPTPQSSKSTAQSSTNRVAEELLRQLNESNLKNLQKIPSVGPKTAQQILLYRKINGKFNSLRDLKEMPNSNTYNKFMIANLLKKK